MDDDVRQKVQNYALKLLSFRPRAKKEMQCKLMRFASKYNITSQIVDLVISDLSLKNLINDEEFANWWKEQRQRSRPKGQRAIRTELLQKGIGKDILEKVLVSNQDEKEKDFKLASRFAERKMSLYKNMPENVIKSKIANLLVRRGFDWEIVHKVIDCFFEKSYNTHKIYGGY